MENSIESGTDYLIKQAVISSTRTDTEVEITAAVAEMIIYEHIEKPYLTMRLSFKEEQNLLQQIDFQGGEKLTITIQQLEETITGHDITKEFLVDEIEKVVRVDERTEIAFLHCIEFHVFESSAQNVNKSYNGSPSEMIKKVIENHITKEVMVDGSDDIQNMKVIIPNLHPIEAALWLTQRASTKEGLPFYLFSTLGTDNLILKDLEKMLTQQAINTETPYTYAPSASTSNKIKHYLIEEYEYSKTENLLKIMRNGNVGAKYVFYDTFRGVPSEISYDVDKVFQGLITKELLGGENSRYNHSPEFKVKDKKIGSYDSKVFSQISSSGAYETVGTNFQSYNDEPTGGGQTKTINRNSLKEFVTKSPITITVRGREFLTGDANYTIGKTIRIRFLDTNTVIENKVAKLDLKKSGDYIIMSAKHVFNGQKITSELICGRVASLGVEADI